MGVAIWGMIGRRFIDFKDSFYSFTHFNVSVGNI